MKTPRHRTSRMGKAALGAAALLLSIAIHAQERRFDIPAGDLKAALDAYIATTGQQLLYRDSDVKGRATKGVSGNMTPEQALSRLLEGANLKVRKDSSGAVLISSDDTKSADTALEPVLVIGKALSHLGDRNRTGTRTDTDPMELAQSVSTISRELVAEQQSRDLAEVLQNVAGVVRMPGAVPSGYLMRGMEASVLTNGALADSGTTRIERPTIAMQSIEVVRGPESIIGGAGAGYGGVINVMTKTADGERVRDVQLRLGSQRLVALGADIGGSFTDDKSLNFRLVAERERRGDTSVGFKGTRRDYVAPSLGWENRKSGTSVLIDMVYSNAFEQQQPSVYTNGDLTDDLPPMRIGRADAGLQYNERSVSLTVSQQLWKGWDFRWRTDAVRNGGPQHFSDGRTDATIWPQVRVEDFSFSETKNRTLAHRAELYGEVETGPITHRLLTSYDWSRVSGEDFVMRTERSYLRDLSTGDVIDTSADDGLPRESVFPGSVTLEKGLLLQDQWQWADFNGLIALRHIDTNSRDIGAAESEHFSKLLPTVGLLYRVTPKVSVYASRAKVFRSNAGKRTFDAQSLPPETGTQLEAGLKALLFDDAVAVTMSVFDLRQRNFADIDPDHGNGEFVVLRPAITSKGGEIEVSGSTGRHWGWRVSGAYNDIRDEAGVPVPSRSRVQAAGHVRYGFTGTESGAWMAASAQWMQGVAWDSTDFPGLTYRARTATLLNFNLGYSAKKSWSVTAGVRNLLDKRIYRLGSFTVLPPREYTATATLSF